MLFAGWEVRIVKTVTEVLKMLPEAAGNLIINLFFSYLVNSTNGKGHQQKRKKKL